MYDNKKLWAETKNALVKDIMALGFPAELGEMVAKNLGGQSPCSFFCFLGLTFL